MERFGVTSAVDDLHSQLTPQQFSYLLSVISPQSSPDLSSDQSKYSSNSSLSPISSIPSDIDKTKPVKTAPTTKYKRTSYLPIKQKSPVKSSPGGGSSLSSSVSHKPKEPLKVQLPHGILKSIANLQMSSFESTKSSDQTKESGLSMEAACSMDYGLIKKFSYAEMKKQIMPDKKKLMPLIEVEEIQRERLRSSSPCSHLPACKRTVRKLTLGYSRDGASISRSSSMETVRAETPTDEDNPYESIAGKIDNEHVNPFPILKQATYSVSQRLKSKKRPSLLDAQRFDREIQQLFQKSEDYKDVSKFFSGNKTPAGNRGRSNSEPPIGTRATTRLSKRVTNPLYKVYDPKGYTKTDDELALECINTVCEDFNKWINSLTNDEDHPAKKFASSAAATLPAVEDLESGSSPFQIGPDFLLTILRKEIEFPQAS